MHPDKSNKMFTFNGILAPEMEINVLSDNYTFSTCCGEEFYIVHKVHNRN